MAKRYAIAALLTDEQKRRALAVPYRLTKTGKLRTAGNWCPLGLALRTQRRAPREWTVADLLEQHGSDPWHDALHAAAEFVDDADHGLIQPSDLPAALGVGG
jgi:hypothetical protein